MSRFTESLFHFTTACSQINHRFLYPNHYGEARWMNRMERFFFLFPSNRGLVLNSNRRLRLGDSYKNLCLVAPTGSGKTTRYVIPNILLCSGSVVVTDPSGEIFQKTSGYMAKRGYNIQVLQPANLRQSLCFNPLVRADSPQKLKQLATTLGRHNTGQDPFWSTGAIHIIYLCLLVLSEADEPKKNHLGNVRLMMNQLGSSDQEIHSFMAARLSPSAYPELKAFLGQDERVIAGILSTARAALDPWSDPDIVQLTKTDSVTIEALRKELTIIYLIVPEDQIPYFSIIMNLFYTACFQHCLRHHSGHNRIPVFFFLDEFGNLGRIDNFATTATTLRKRSCSISIILQELSQLTAAYGPHDSKSIFSGGMANKLFYSGLDLETCTYLESVLGKATVTGAAPQSDSISTKNITTGKSLMSADQIRMMGQNDAILISGSYPPLRLKMLPYFRDFRTRRLSKNKPVHINGGKYFSDHRIG
jgi:type IV secretion system protein VirD4